jgi:hypothetical protein
MAVNRQLNVQELLLTPEKPTLPLAILAIKFDFGDQQLNTVLH